MSSTQNQNYIELNSKVENIQATLQELYVKVVSGNGKAPVLSRLDMQEQALNDLIARHNSCQAQKDIIAMKAEDKFIHNSIQEIKNTLATMADHDTYRKRERRSFWLQVVHTVVYIALAAAVSVATSTAIQ